MSEVLEITYRDVEAFGKEGVLMVDLRDEEARNYGIVPYAKWIVPEALEEHLQEFLEYSKVILFDTNGAGSVAHAKHLRERGVNAYSLVQGYSGYLLAIMEAEEASVSSEERLKNIELSIRKKFHKELFTKFAKAINTYEMVAPGDKIAVCISGGKDSMLLAKLFQELKRHNKFEFELVFLVMDPGYSQANRLVIENNARILGIPVTIFSSEIFDAVYDIEKSPCYLCARMRRGYLYSKAKDLGCNKIALGHHYDDVIETILMGMLYGGQIQTMMPKLHSTNFEGMELIRPLYFVREADIKHWRDYNGLHFLQCACRFTEQCAMTGTSDHHRSKRQEVKELIATMKKGNPFVEANIFRSVENVNLSTIIAYKKNGVKHPFLETYDDPRGYSEEE